MGYEVAIEIINLQNLGLFMNIIVKLVQPDDVLDGWYARFYLLKMTARVPDFSTLMSS